MVERMNSEGKEPCFEPIGYVSLRPRRQGVRQEVTKETVALCWSCVSWFRREMRHEEISQTVTVHRELSLLWFSLQLNTLEAAVTFGPVHQKPRPQETKGPASTLCACLQSLKNFLNHQTCLLAKSLLPHQLQASYSIPCIGSFQEKDLYLCV